MSILNIALVFLISWWLGWFLTLPFGVKAPKKVEPGHAASAPDKPRLITMLARGGGCLTKVIRKNLRLSSAE